MLRHSSSCVVDGVAIKSKQTRLIQRRSLLDNADPMAAPPTSSNDVGDSQDLVLYDSLSKSYQKINLPPPTSRKGLAWYTCGPTTYAPAHLGHARTYIWIDILRRTLDHITERNNGTPPLFVMNITDVDDKILAAARESQEPPLQLARRFEQEFWRDMDALGCLRPHVVTRVTENVDSSIVPYIHKLEMNGLAYAVPGVGVYFDVRAFEAKLGNLTKYGKLAPPAAAADFFGNHPRETEESTTKIDKRDVRDFALWKCRKEGEDLFWESPWGQGRPGWHIECSAMIEAVQQRFQESHMFLVHAGGIDLKFPHHTNEIAQAEAYLHGDETRWTGEWISRWVHTGHVHIDGMKMAKSLKNFITIQELLLYDKELSSSPLVAPADDFRLWCLGMSGSYRGPATFSYDRIQEARIVRQKIVRFLLDGEDWLQHAGETTSKSWRNEDAQFFNRVNDASFKCFQSLLGSDRDVAPFDVDGSAFVAQLLEIAEAGGDYLRNASKTVTPVEPLIAVLSTMRKLLSLVGFTDATTRAGLEADSKTGQVVGGERALIDEFVRFRALVRRAALDCSSDDETTTRQLRSQILEYSDDVRKRRLPTIGVEVMDPKSDGTEDDVSQVRWRFCLPQTSTEFTDDDNQNAKTLLSLPNVSIVPLEDFFRVGQYEGQFSEFTQDGVPTCHADGTDVSKALRKKLMKKREKYQRRVEK